MSLRIEENKFFTKTARTRTRNTTTTSEQADCENQVESIFRDFLMVKKIMFPDGPHLHRERHSKYLLKALRHLPASLQTLDASRPWLVYWITHSLYLLNEQLDDVFIDQISDFLGRCQNADGGFAGGPGQISHLAPTYAAVNALCLLHSERAYQVINREKLLSWLFSLRDPDNGSFRLHMNGECDIRAIYCAASVATLCQLENRQELFEKTPDWIASCQTYEGGFGACPGAEAHGGYSFCGYAALLLLNRESICNRQDLLRWTVHRQMSFEGGFQGRTNKLVDGCYSFWVGALLPLIQAAENQQSTNDEQDQLFHSIAAQEYVLLCSQSSMEGGFNDRPKDSRTGDLYHTCYCLSGLSLFQEHDERYHSSICGGSANKLCRTHPVFNIGYECAQDAIHYYSQKNSRQ